MTRFKECFENEKSTIIIKFYSSVKGKLLGKHFVQHMMGEEGNDNWSVSFCHHVIMPHLMPYQTRIPHS